MRAPTNVRNRHLTLTDADRNNTPVNSALAEPRPIDVPWLHPVDDFEQRHLFHPPYSSPSKPVLSYPENVPHGQSFGEVQSVPSRDFWLARSIYPLASSHQAGYGQEHDRTNS